MLIKEIRYPVSEEKASNFPLYVNSLSLTPLYHLKYNFDSWARNNFLTYNKDDKNVSNYFYPVFRARDLEVRNYFFYAKTYPTLIYRLDDGESAVIFSNKTVDSPLLITKEYIMDMSTFKIMALVATEDYKKVYFGMEVKAEDCFVFVAEEFKEKKFSRVLKIFLSYYNKANVVSTTSDKIHETFFSKFVDKTDTIDLEELEEKVFSILEEKAEENNKDIMQAKLDIKEQREKQKYRDELLFRLKDKDNRIDYNEHLLELLFWELSVCPYETDFILSNLWYYFNPVFLKLVLQELQQIEIFNIYQNKYITEELKILITLKIEDNG
jgi:hypothetical protein